MLNQKSLIIRKKRQDFISKVIIFCFSLIAILSLLFIFGFVLKAAIPSISNIGFFKIFFNTNFSPSQGNFGVWGPLIITLFTSITSVLIASFLSIRLAIFIFYRLNKTKKLARFLVELLATIPSIIFGLFASNSLGKIVEFVTRASTPNTLVTAVIMLVFIVTPIMTSLILNQLKTVPITTINSSLALGNTKTYSIYNIVKKEIRAGIIVSAMVAFGRAIGETMAVSILLAGGVSNPFQGGVGAFLNGSWNTLGGNIAYWMTSDASSPYLMSALYAAGIMLFVIIMLINVFVLNISKKKAFEEKKYSFLFVKKKKNIFVWYIQLTMFILFYPIMLIMWIFSIVGKSFSFAIQRIRYFTSNATVIMFNPVISKDMDNQKYYYIQSKDHRKYFYDRLKVLLEFLCLFITLFVLGWIFFNVFSKGASYFQWNHLFSAKKNSLGTSLMVTIVLIIVSISIGLMFALGTAIYLSEFAPKKSKFSTILRFFLDSLGGTPSILFGMFGLVFFLQTMHLASGTLWKTGSLIAGSLTMVIVILPSFTRVIEQSLIRVPNELRTASLALGASKWETIHKIVIPHASKGITSAIILSMGRVVSETAPIYLTAGLLAHKLGLLFPGQTLTSRILYNALYSPYPPTLAMGIAYEAAMVTFVLVVVIAGLATYGQDIKNLINNKLTSIFSMKKARAT